MKEQWKPIKNYEGLYEVSNYGNIKSVKKNIVKTFRRDNSGYPRTNLSKNGKPTTVYIHRIVAETFIPNPDGKPTVDHIDRNVDNNHVDNLRWADLYDQRANQQDGRMRAIKLLDKRTGKIMEFKSMAQASRYYGYHKEWIKDLRRTARKENDLVKIV